MSSLPSIRALGLGKSYRRGQASRYRSLREVLSGLIRLQRKQLGAARATEFRAIDDVNLDIWPGEVVGLIGRNGAGKSTLIRLLSGITAPSSGRCEVRGTVGSLLEVGVGFHPELSGRENIFLNGAILGMSSAEVRRSLQQIVDFSEIGDALDTQVKYYSSGMYVRLAFSVAAHLTTDILFVDEVLAVGDVAFQRRCLGKMDDVARSGRTVVLVSHNMAPIQALCSRAVLLDKGRLIEDGPPEKIIEHYHRLCSQTQQADLRSRQDRRGDGFARFTSVEFANASQPELGTLRCGDRARVVLEYESDRELEGVAFMVGLYGSLGQPLYRLDSENAGGLTGRFPARGKLVCDTDPITLSPGRYSCNLALMMRGSVVDHVETAYWLDIDSQDFYGTGNLPSPLEVPILIPQKWELIECR